MTTFEEIRQLQRFLSGRVKTEEQERKFQQFMINFEEVSTVFQDMLKEHQKKNQRFDSGDFGESDFK